MAWCCTWTSIPLPFHLKELSAVLHSHICQTVWEFSWLAYPSPKTCTGKGGCKCIGQFKEVPFEEYKFEKPFDINVLNFSVLVVNLHVSKFLGESQILWAFYVAISRGVLCKAGSAIFFYECPDSKYFRLCGTHTASVPYSLFFGCYFCCLKKTTIFGKC